MTIAGSLLALFGTRTDRVHHCSHLHRHSPRPHLHLHVVPAVWGRVPLLPASRRPLAPRCGLPQPAQLFCRVLRSEDLPHHHRLAVPYRELLLLLVPHPAVESQIRPLLFRCAVTIHSQTRQCFGLLINSLRCRAVQQKNFTLHYM